MITNIEFLKRYKKRIFFVSLLVIVEAAITFFIPLIFRKIFDFIQISKFMGAKNLFVYVFFLITVLYLIRILYQFLITKFSLLFKVKESKRLFGLLFHVKLPFIQKKGPTYFTERILGSVNILFTLVLNFFSEILMVFLMIFITLCLVFKIDMIIFLLFVILLPVKILPLKKLNRILQKKSEVLQSVSAINIKSIINVVQGIQEIKQISEYDAFEEVIKNYTRTFQEENSKVALYAQGMSLLISYSVEIVKSAILLFSIYLLMTHYISISDVIFISMLLGIYKGALDRLNRINVSFRDVRVVLEFINKEIVGNFEEDSGKLLLKRIENIEFKIDKFGYSPNKAVLRDINLSVKKGQTIGIVSKSGMGKTTLVKLLLRFYDVDKILINDKNIKKYTLTSLRKNLYAVSQTPYIFPGTVKSNIIVGVEESDDNLQQLFRIPFFTDFIKEMPRGLDTTIGEGGYNLSGGQKQKVMLARLLVRDAGTIILDEATAGIDGYTEAQILQLLSKFKAGKIIFIVSHRLSTIKSCDKIIVIKGGEIICTGLHNELIKTCDEYKNLFSSQLITDNAELRE